MPRQLNVIIFWALCPELGFPPFRQTFLPSDRSFNKFPLRRQISLRTRPSTSFPMLTYRITH